MWVLTRHFPSQRQCWFSQRNMIQIVAPPCPFAHHIFFPSNEKAAPDFREWTPVSCGSRTAAGSREGFPPSLHHPLHHPASSRPKRAIDHVICRLMSAPRASTAAQRFPVAASLSTSAVQTHCSRNPAANQCPSAVNRICLHVTGNQLHKYTHKHRHAHSTVAFQEADGGSLIATWW